MITPFPTITFALSNFAQALPWTFATTGFRVGKNIFSFEQQDALKRVAKSTLQGAVLSVAVNGALALLPIRFALLHSFYVKSLVAVLSTLFVTYLWHPLRSQEETGNNILGTQQAGIPLEEVKDELEEMDLVVAENKTQWDRLVDNNSGKCVLFWNLEERQLRTKILDEDRLVELPLGKYLNGAFWFSSKSGSSQFRVRFDQLLVHLSEGRYEFLRNS